MSKKKVIVNGDFVNITDGEFRGEVGRVIGEVEHFDIPTLIVEVDGGFQTTIEASMLELIG